MDIEYKIDQIIENLEQINSLIDDIDNQIKEEHENLYSKTYRRLANEAREISSLLMDLYYQVEE